MIVKTQIKVELSFHGELHYVTGVKIKRLTGYKGNSCVIYLPLRLWHVSNTRDYDAEEIKVWAGYNGNMNLLYIGYVTKIRMEGTLVCIESSDDLGMICDDMTTYFGYAKHDVRLSEIVSCYDLKNLSLEVLDDVLLGRVRFSALTGDVLRELSSTYGIRIFGRIEDEKNHYYMSLYNSPSSIKKLTPHILKCDLLKRSLVRSANVMLILSGLDKANNVKKVTLTEGAPPYRTIRRTIYGHSDNDELVKLGRGIIEMATSGLSTDGTSNEYGLNGSVTISGESDVQLYDIVEMPDGKYLRGGSYEVTSNIITIDGNGYRQKLQLGKDISKQEEERDDD